MKLTSGVVWKLLLVVVVMSGDTFAQGPQPPRNACSQQAGGPPPCRDTDGDGLCDSWELAKRLPGGQPLQDADPSLPDVYVQYDFMVLPDDGNSCTVAPRAGAPFASPDCSLDQYCSSGRCVGHSDEPDPQAIQMVVDAYAAHHINLHVVRGKALPHARVLTFGPEIPACTADSSALLPERRAADFYMLKEQNLDPGRAEAFHYAVFGHFHTCDSVEDCAQLECANPDTGRQPLFTETGIAEQPGNDLIVAFGRLRDRGVLPTAMNQGGTFMHELGHNLGLDHGGPIALGRDFSINFKPNYLSVMNYSFQSIGIPSASPDCPTDDLVCKTTPVATRLDYSNTGLPALDEADLDESAGLRAGHDISFVFCPDKRAIPGDGPVDWNCNGNDAESGIAAEVNNDGELGVLLGSSDWDHLVYRFQCVSTFNDGMSEDAPAAEPLGGGRRLPSIPMRMHLQRRDIGGCFSSGTPWTGTKTAVIRP